MAFWGVELKPGKPFRQIPTEGTGSQLHLSNAVLALNPKQGERTVVKCKVGDNPEIFLASLTGGAVESCSLDIIMADDVVFSVTGSTSVHLTGYYMPIEPQEETDDEFDEYGEEDFDDEDDDDDSEYDEYEEDEDDEEESDEEEEDDQIISRHGNKGVKIEEITDDTAVGALPVIRANPIVSETYEESESDEEDEDGFERHHKRKAHKIQIEAGPPAAKKQAVEGETKNEASQAGNGGLKGTPKPNKKAEAAAKTPALEKTKASGSEAAGKTPKGEKTGGEATPAVSEKKRKAEKTPGGKSANGAEKATAEKKPKAEKSPNGAAVAEKKTVTSQATGVTSQEKAPAVEEKRVDAGGKKKQGGDPSAEAKSPKAGKGGKGTVREFPNGLKIEELGMGRPDGKRAEKGKRISMQYVGKLAKNGKVFDASRGKPFSFRLGTGEVIAGWDKGIEGMRVGDKRRLTIPPSMGYGARGAPPDIPGNATLLFDVELVNVK